MNRIRIITAIAATLGGVLVPSVAGATGDAIAATDDAKQQLDQLCREKGGMVVASPYALARCQDARRNKGFDPERELCVAGLAGQFVVSSEFSRPNRAAWACISLVPIAP